MSCYFLYGKCAKQYRDVKLDLSDICVDNRCFSVNIFECSAIFDNRKISLIKKMC